MARKLTSEEAIRNTQRVYRLHDFSQAQFIRPDVASCVAGKVNSADKLYLVIESVRLDTKTAPGRLVGSLRIGAQPASRLRLARLEVQP